VYGIDIENRKLLRRRTWRWLRVRILGLLTIPPVVVPTETDQPALVIPQTRLAYALDPPGGE
jgi:hypothetical protein